MAGRIDGILNAVGRVPWAILPEKLDAILDVLEMRAAGLTFTADEIQARVGEGMKTAPKASQKGSVAVLPLYGVVAHRMNLMTDISGGTSTEQFARDFEGLLANDQVSAIVLDVDSPGGAVDGVPELAALIRSARGKKPIVAVANAMMASAAYWLGAQADEVVATPSALVGSIGVFAVHTDISSADEKDGVKRTIIRFGKHKAEGNPYEALSDAAREHMQSVVDDTGHLFVSAVAKARGLTPAAVRSEYGDGRTFTARQALEAGLIDRIATLDEVLTELTGSRAGPRQRLRADTQSLTIAALDSGGDLLSGGLVTLDLPGTSTTTAGGAGVERVIALVPAVPSDLAPAPKAKEHTVSEITTAAPQNGADSSDDLMALAEAHGKTLADVRQWKKDGKSVAQVRDALLAEYQAGARSLQADPSVRLGADREAAQPFASLGEQLQAIANVARGRVSEADRKRLLTINAAVSGGSSAVGSDGGFLIQHQFTTDLVKDAFNEGALLSRCDNTEIGADANGLKVVYIDETSRATGSRWGGVQVYNADEAETVTAKKPKLGKWELDLGKKMGVAYATEELLADAAAMADVYNKAFASEFAFKCDDEIFRGIGGAEFQGILTGPSTVSVAKETGQLADTIVAENVMKMWARVHPRSKGNGVWLVNPETSVQLHQLQIGTGTSATLVYLPPGGLSGQPYGTIFGRPVIETEYNAALGDKGDICFVDLSRYKTITKGGIKGSESMHVRFLYDEMTFKWTFRINGAPKDKSALTAYKAASGATLSPFVFLDARA